MSPSQMGISPGFSPLPAWGTRPRQAPEEGSPAGLVAQVPSHRSELGADAVEVGRRAARLVIVLAPPKARGTARSAPARDVRERTLDVGAHRVCRRAPVVKRPPTPVILPALPPRHPTAGKGEAAPICRRAGSAGRLGPKGRDLRGRTRKLQSRRTYTLVGDKLGQAMSFADASGLMSRTNWSTFAEEEGPR
jgi:hypothetical protein